MSELQIFQNPEFGQVRTVTVKNEPWFVGKDVAEALGYSNTRDAMAKHVDTEDKGVAKCDTPSGSQEMTVINESGLYSLVLSSKLPSAKEFKRWITHEVIPAIRKHGAYMTEDVIKKAITEPDFLIGLLNEMKKEKAARLAAEQQIEADRPKVTFANAVIVSKDGMLIGMLAKILHQNGVNMGQKRLFEWMRKNGYLMKSGADKNMPTQRAREMGLFKVKERAIDNPDGSVRLTRTTLVTGKGQQFFVNKFLAGREAHD